MIAAAIIFLVELKGSIVQEGVIAFLVEVKE
jgi:hypothetical protein